MKRVKRLVFKCVDCDVEKEYVPWRAKGLKLNNGEYRCVLCSRSHNALQQTHEQRSTRMKRAHAANPEMAKRVGTIRRSYRTTPAHVWHKKQMDTIKSDPIKYRQYCEKRRRISLEFHNTMTPREKEEHYVKVFANTSGRSKAEDDFFVELHNQGIVFETNQCVSGFFPDGIDRRSKVIVEFYGDVYHCNPTKFHEPSQYCSWISRTVQEQWSRDQKRLAVFYKLGYKVIIVWESDWYTTPSECVERILNAVQEN